MTQRQPITDKEGRYIEAERAAGVPWKVIAEQFGVTDRQLQKRFSKWARAQKAKDDAVAKRLSDELAPAPEKPLVIMLRSWPAHWLEMDRRQFCNLRARGYKQADVARMLRLEESLVEKAWDLEFEGKE